MFVKITFCAGVLLNIHSFSLSLFLSISLSLIHNHKQNFFLSSVFLFHTCLSLSLIFCYQTTVQLYPWYSYNLIWCGSLNLEKLLTGHLDGHSDAESKCRVTHFIPLEIATQFVPADCICTSDHLLVLKA